MFFAQEGSTIYEQAYKRLVDYDVIPDVSMHMATKEPGAVVAAGLGTDMGDVKKLLSKKHMVPTHAHWLS